MDKQRMIIETLLHSNDITNLAIAHLIGEIKSEEEFKTMAVLLYEEFATKLGIKFTVVPVEEKE